MTGTALATLITSVNGGDPIDDDLMSSLVEIGKTVLFGERDWMTLRKTDSSLSFSASSTWETAYSLNGITDFSRFYGDCPIRIFDGVNCVERYRQVPWDQRLEYKDVNNTFVYDEANNRIYFNGTGAMAGTIYINYIKNTTTISLSSSTDIKTAGTFPFPAEFHPILAFYAVGMSKGAIDYDDINKSMLPTNQAILVSIKNALEKWDTKKQLAEVENTDPYRAVGDGFMANHINMQG